MIFRRLGLIHKDQRGITMIELTMALLITVIITAGITMTIFQVISGNARSNNHMIAVRQVQNAGYWVSHDVQMAQSVDTTDDPETTELELVTLTWTDWETGDVHQVVYTLADNKLQRSSSVNDESPTVTFAAEFVDPDNTSCAFDGDVLTLTITVTVGSGEPQEASETRIYEIMPRPSV